MAIGTEIKKRVVQEWLDEFPQLSAFAQNKLYKVIGCNVIGIELIKLPHSDDYRPHFVIYPLWKSDIKKCLDAPSLMQQLYNKKRLQFNIPFISSSEYLDEAIDCFKIQFPISLNNDVPLKSLFDFVNSHFNNLLIQSNSAAQAKLFEIQFYNAIYTHNENLARTILLKIQKASVNWNMQLFENWHGNFYTWFKDLEKIIMNNKILFVNVENNLLDRKVSKLNRSQFV